MRYKLVIFDYDGTLADTRGPIVAAKQETMLALGLPVLDEEACASTIGLTAEMAFRETYPDLPDETIRKCVDLYRTNFAKLMETAVPPLFPGVTDVLKRIAASGMTLSIASSRQDRMLIELLKKQDLYRFFPYILGGNDTPRLKPHPDAVIRTVTDLHVRPEEALVVGDMPYDILMGSRAGAATCGVTYGNASREKLLEAGADHIIDRIGLLKEILGIS